MNRANTFRWTNKSVLALAGSEDPISVMERKARDLVLLARDKGRPSIQFSLPIS